MTKLILLSVITALINTTNLRFGVLLIGEPLVYGPLLGLFLHNLPLGLFIGAICQFLWIRSMPVGVRVQTNYTIMTLFTIYILDSFGKDGPKIFPLAFLAAFIMAFLGKHLETLIKRLDNSLVDNIMLNIRTANLNLLHAVYLLGYTLVFAVLIFGGLVFANYIIIAVTLFVPTQFLGAFEFAYPYLGLFAISLALQAVTVNYKYLYLVIGAVIGIILVFFRFNMIASTLILTVLAIAISWFVNRRLSAPRRRTS
jgi:mannose/fructose/N-acetylgalactosamine-specific phosphotransferase system component IIC